MFVIDTSVILAFVRREPGGERLPDYAGDALMSTVNLAETVTKCIDLGIDPDSAIAFVRESGIELVDLTAEQAILAGRLRHKAPKGILSLGDRACIAAAILSGRTAVTADKVWAKFDLGCKVELIR